MTVVRIEAILLLAILQTDAAAATNKPNVVLFLADDYGWANMGVHRRDAGTSKQVRGEVNTPNMDALIDNGVLLDRYYAYKICSPSRSSLQSGRLAVHVNAVNIGVTVVNPSDPVSGAAGIPRNMTGLAQKLRDGGYKTHMVGKWDAGMATPDRTPWGRGYDTGLYYYQHANDYWRKNMVFQSTGEVDNCLNSFVDFSMHNSTYRGGVRDGISMSPECLEDPSSHKGCYEEEAFKARALAVIQEHNATNLAAPMFLFYAFHLLHSPLQVPMSYLEKIDELVFASGGKTIDTQNRRLYAAMTLYMDEAIGEVVAAVKAKGMWDNTLVIFSADNGGAIYEPGSANNHPLKGGKISDWEGGVRVNAFVSGGFVPIEKRGTKHLGIISIADWYGTLCELAGVSSTDDKAAEANVWLQKQGLPLLPPVDSVAQWGFILNGTSGRSQIHLSEQALLQWPYKLVTGKQFYSAWQGELYPNCSTIALLSNNKGPAFIPKVFNVHINPTKSPEQMDALTWTQDCGMGCLFNVDTDPTEHEDLSNDLASASILAKLQSDLKALNEGLFQPERGVEDISACLQSIDNGGYYGPFIDTEGWYSPLPQRTPGEYQIATTLRTYISVLNKDIIEKGVAKAAEEYFQKHFEMINSKLDYCSVDANESFVDDTESVDLIKETFATEMIVV